MRVTTKSVELLADLLGKSANDLVACSYVDIGQFGQSVLTEKGKQALAVQVRGQSEAATALHTACNLPFESLIDAGFIELHKPSLEYRVTKTGERLFIERLRETQPDTYKRWQLAL